MRFERIVNVSSSNLFWIPLITYAFPQSPSLLQDLKALMLILSVQRRKSTPTDLIHHLAHMNHVCRQLLLERAAKREKARQEQEQRKRAMQRVER